MCVEEGGPWLTVNLEPGAAQSLVSAGEVFSVFFAGLDAVLKVLD